MSHTPGPWTIEYEDDNGNLLDDGVTIESCEGPVAFRVIDCSASLISAAPELLASLKAAVESINEACHCEETEECAEAFASAGWFLDAVKAIAKAEGSGQ
jgi:hypothetical protein